MTPAERARRYRQRRARREAQYRVTVPERVLWALIARGMSEDDARNRAKVERELAAVLAEWAKRWTA